MSKYATLDVPDKFIPIGRALGFVARRGNQHGSHWYLTNEGVTWFRAWLKKQAQ